jgi:hypothetical protein
VAEPALAPAGPALEPRALAEKGDGRGPVRDFLGRLRAERARRKECAAVADASRFGKVWFEPGLAAADGTDLGRFRRVLLDHNRRLDDLALVRQAVRDAAAAELAGGAATNVLETIVHLRASAYASKAARDRKAADPGRAGADLAARLDGDLGHPLAFAPWDGWWAGEFANPKRYFNLHVWDPAFVVGEAGYDQHVQPVTQTEARVGGAPRWFGSARLLSDEPAQAGLIDHALNVWSARDGITGYVEKAGDYLPQPGFLIETNILLWCALFERRGRDGGADKLIGDFGEAGVHFMLFVEVAFRGGKESDAYVIRGALGRAKKVGGVISVVGGFDLANVHSGDYGIVRPLRDRESLRCAVDRGELGGMSRRLASRIVDETAPAGR